MDTQNEYEKALDCYNSGYEGDPDFLEHAHGQAIRNALRIANALERAGGYVDRIVREGIKKELGI